MAKNPSFQKWFISPKDQDITNKYRELVLAEEKRIADLTRKRFSKLHNLSSHPSEVIGIKSTSKYEKATYQYLRQRYYRLKRIEKEQVSDATITYKYEDYFLVIDGFMDHYRINDLAIVQEYKRLKNSLSKTERAMFIELGLDYDLRMIYLDLGKDLRAGATTTIEQIIGNLKSAQRYAHKKK